ncbi:hypothetical protein BDV40DRAFT_305927 [Aspergillus tamarii]|uniref:Uncharacterized protein n=1 Tax=Aspergillus tamarii TaxID=41984 RepID=A0A5N6UDD6_ASPTM|nr:hypothetical protein BDV40DRAFT_305927 [Aspergillus tamarii]
MLRGEPQDWFATVLSPAPRWRDMVAAPIHAALWNKVDVDARPLPFIIGAIEEQVEVLPLINPTVRDQILAASASLSTYIANDDFDNMCRELEGAVPVTEMGRSTLPLRALFCPGQARISTEEWLSECQNIDINVLIPILWSLNNSQKSAMQQLFQYKFSMVIGPSGMGKHKS